VDPVLIANSVASGFLLGGILALTALGLSIVLGVMRLINLAHGEILIGGAYASLFLLQFTGLDPLVSLPLVAAVVGLLAWPVQRILLAPLSSEDQNAPMMTTFGISIILQNLFLYFFSADTRAIDAPYASRPFNLGPITVPLVYVIGFVLSVAIIVAVHILVYRTAFGRELRASATDAAAAQSVGVNVGRVYMLTFVLGAACAAVGGALIGIIFSFTPTSGATYLLLNFAIVVLGGLGNIVGTLGAGIALGVVQGIGGVILGDGYRDFIGLLLFIAVLAFRPYGVLKKAAG
jgi:branched-chain amino acid transport system permease protein